MPVGEKGTGDPLGDKCLLCNDKQENNQNYFHYSQTQHPHSKQCIKTQTILFEIVLLKCFWPHEHASQSRTLKMRICYVLYVIYPYLRAFVFKACTCVTELQNLSLILDIFKLSILTGK